MVVIELAPEIDALGVGAVANDWVGKRANKAQDKIKAFTANLQVGVETQIQTEYCSVLSEYQ